MSLERVMDYSYIPKGVLCRPFGKKVNFRKKEEWDDMPYSGLAFETMPEQMPDLPPKEEELKYFNHLEVMRAKFWTEIVMEILKNKKLTLLSDACKLADEAVKEFDSRFL